MYVAFPIMVLGERKLFYSLVKGNNFGYPSLHKKFLYYTGELAFESSPNWKGPEKATFFKPKGAKSSPRFFSFLQLSWRLWPRSLMWVQQNEMTHFLGPTKRFLSQTSDAKNDKQWDRATISPFRHKKTIPAVTICILCKKNNVIYWNITTIVRRK